MACFSAVTSPIPFLLKCSSSRFSQDYEKNPISNSGEKTISQSIFGTTSVTKPNDTPSRQTTHQSQNTHWNALSVRQAESAIRKQSNTQSGLLDGPIHSSKTQALEGDEISSSSTSCLSWVSTSEWTWRWPSGISWTNQWWMGEMAMKSLQEIREDIDQTKIDSAEDQNTLTRDS